MSDAAAAAAPAAEAGSAKTPADFLKSIRGKPVVVKLNSGVDYRGILACLDGYMNIAMEQTEVRARWHVYSLVAAWVGRRRAGAASAWRPSTFNRHWGSSLPSANPKYLSVRCSRRCASCCAVAGAALTFPSPPPLPPQEYVNGQLKNKYGDAFIRGNNGECAQMPKPPPAVVPRPPVSFHPTGPAPAGPTEPN